MATTTEQIDMPVVRNPGDFDPSSGSWLERLIFNHRLLIVALCAIATVFLGFEATRLKENASFEKMLPVSHPYIQHYLENRKILRSLGGNTVRIVIENTQGTIFDKDFLLVAQKVTDTLLVTPGVDRSWVRGLWTPSLRWTEVTEEGYRGGPVMPDDWDGSAQAEEQLGINIARSGVVGSYVAGNLRSTLVVVPLLEFNQETGKPIDYSRLSEALETRIRALQTDKVRIHIVGFAKIVGDLIDGLNQIALFFAISTLIAGICVFFYTRCLRSTLLLVTAALLGVVWLLGLLQVLGYVLDPYSILVPFLIFAIGLSHGAQKMNGIMQDIGRGTHRYVAARYTFRRLFIAGLTALGTNILGFAALAVIDIPVIRDLALTTSIGIGILIFTKLVLVPVALSYVGVSKKAAQRSLEAQQSGHYRFWLMVLVRCTERRRALAVIIVSAVIALAGFAVSIHLQFGDLDAGAPELRPDSRYNRDNAFINANYGRSSDQFVVMLKTPPDGCAKYETLVETDRLAEHLRDVAGVLSVVSAADVERLFQSGVYEGNPKWTTISPNPSNLQGGIENVQADHPELGERSCSLTPVVAYLKDHRAATLTRVVEAVEKFAKKHNTPAREFQLAAGNAGIEAATNIVVRRANRKLLLILYTSVTILCFIAFRSWRAVVVALIPLIISSILCEALMVLLGIGVKVATLPVIAVGVGVGVDYALYLLSVQLARQRAGDSLAVAYMHALKFTGRVVALIGFTMAIGVITWAWSPIKFQADMGILLTFMFLWNMIGALFLIPALSHFLLRREPLRLSRRLLPLRGLSDEEVTEVFT
jgi:predicted RND superfamily exporter protein